MAAVDTKVIGQYVAIQLITQLSAEGAATNTTGQPAEDYPGNSTEGRADWAYKRASDCADLATG